MHTLRIVTLNTWNCQGQLDLRLPLMCAGLQTLDADVVLLQEVFREVPSGLDVTQVLADALGMSHAFAPARKKLRKYADKPVLCHSGLAVLARGDVQAFTPVVLPHDERDGERIGQLARVNVQGLDIVVGNVHLTHLTGEDTLRERQLATMASRLAEEAGAAVTLLGGDMNLPVGHAVLDRFAQSHSFSPIGYGDADAPPTTLNPVNGVTPSAGVIDHLFVKAGSVDIRGARAVAELNTPNPQSGVYPSDHMAVVAELDLS